MRRFNLAKSAVADDAGKEAVGDTKTSARTRLLLLTGLLIVVAAYAATRMIGRFAGVVTPQTHQAAPPAAVPSAPVAVPEPPRPSDVRPDAGPGLEVPAASPRDAAGDSPRITDAELPTPGPTRRGRFTVQIGAMAQWANALALLKRLEEAGYTATIRKRGGSVTQHVVLVTTPSDRAEADSVLARLRAEGIPVRVSESNGGYRAEAGRSIGLDEAIDIAHRLQERGFSTRIDSVTVGSTLYLVRTGDFDSLAEARQKGQELREKGFPVLIVKK